MSSKVSKYTVFESNDLKMLLDFYGCPFEESSGSRSCLVSSIIVGKSVTWESLFISRQRTMPDVMRPAVGQSP